MQDIDFGKINFLLQKDQSLIKQFKEKIISQTQWVEQSTEISKEFLAILDVVGFPYKNRAPEQTYKAAITLGLHLNLEEMKIFFDRFIENTPSTQIDQKDYVIYVDRIRILSGKPQIYGTQYKKRSDGTIEILPLEDQENIDEIRRETGLGTLTEYIASIQN